MPGSTAKVAAPSPENNRRFKRAQGTARHLGYVVHYGRPFVIYPLGSTTPVATPATLAELGQWVHDAATAFARARRAAGVTAPVQL